MKQELAFAQTYLEIEKARFGERLQFTLPSETEADGLSLPSLTVQPIVENAVRHGIGRSIEGGTIVVRIDRSPDRFLLTVENPAEPTEHEFFRPGHALANIRERLQLTDGSKGLLEATRPTPDMVAVTIGAPSSHDPIADCRRRAACPAASGASYASTPTYGWSERRQMVSKLCSSSLIRTRMSCSSISKCPGSTASTCSHN